MSLFAFSTLAMLPNSFAPAQSPQSGAEANQTPEENARANAKSGKRQSVVERTNFTPSAADAAGLSHAVRKSPYEKPFAYIGGVALDSQESGWIALAADPTKAGLHLQGRWQADVEIATNLARVLLAQIIPTRPERTTSADDAGPMRAEALKNLWVDVLLHQVESANPILCPLSMLELAAYRVVNGDVKLIKSVKSSPMPMEMISVFTLGYRLKGGKIMMDICSDLDRLTTTHLEIENFGETLPIIKLRSGRALPNGIFRAKYRQIVSWSA